MIIKFQNIPISIKEPSRSNYWTLEGLYENIEAIQLLEKVITEKRKRKKNIVVKTKNQYISRYALNLKPDKHHPLNIIYITKT